MNMLESSRRTSPNENRNQEELSHTRMFREEGIAT